MGRRYKLSEQEWDEIMNSIENNARSISKLARKYKISRQSIYARIRHDILNKKEKYSLFDKVKRLFQK
jgi:Mor family transcriptional regulator